MESTRIALILQSETLHYSCFTLFPKREQLLILCIYFIARLKEILGECYSGCTYGSYLRLGALLKWHTISRQSDSFPYIICTYIFTHTYINMCVYIYAHSICTYIHLGTYITMHIHIFIYLNAVFIEWGWLIIDILYKHLDMHMCTCKYTCI